MRNHASGLMSQLYDYWSPHIDVEEIDFYRTLIREGGGTALELACATGRLLLPFLKEGFSVEGVDSSKEMLDILRNKAAKANLAPVLYHQKLEEIDIKKKYQFIYISLGSFQFIHNTDDAKLLLAKCYNMLEETHKCTVAFFLPWNEMPLESNGWNIVKDVRDKKRNERYIRREKSHHDPVEQIIESQVRFELWSGQDLLEIEEKNLFIRWYSKGECYAMFKDAGFKQVEMQRSYVKGGVNRPSFMLFTATK